MNEELSHIQTVLKDVLQDPSFNTKSSVAAAARQDALTLLEWCQQEQNHDGVTQFMRLLLSDLNQYIAEFKGKKAGHDRLWRKYFALCTSEKFINHWKVFLSNAQWSYTPVLYQHLVDLLFKRCSVRNLK